MSQLNQDLILYWCNLDTNHKSLVGCRSSHSISVIGNKIYLFGGEIIARTPINSKFYVRDIISQSGDTWNLLDITSDIEPIPRVAHSQAVIGKNIWIFGGRQGITMKELALNDLWKFNTVTASWRCINNYKGIAPIPRSFHKMVSLGDKLYIYGGCSKQGRLSDLYCFDTINNIWEDFSHITTPKGLPGRGGAGFLGSTCGNYLFVVGGFCGYESNAVYKFSLITKTWITVYPEGNNIIKPFSVSCGSVIDNKLIFFGGEIDPSDKGHEGAGDFSSDILILDDITGKKIDSIGSIDGKIPIARGWSSADCYQNNSIIIFGGLSGDDNNPLRLGDTWLLKLQKK